VTYVLLDFAQSFFLPVLNSSGRKSCRIRRFTRRLALLNASPNDFPSPNQSYSSAENHIAASSPTGLRIAMTSSPRAVNNGASFALQQALNTKPRNDPLLACRISSANADFFTLCPYPLSLRNTKELGVPCPAKWT